MTSFPCPTGESGFISWREIKEMIAAGAKVTVDTTAKAAYLVKGAQWIGYDNPDTLRMKIVAAKGMGLGGVMVSGPLGQRRGPAWATCRRGLETSVAQAKAADLYRLAPHALLHDWPGLTRQPPPVPPVGIGGYSLLFCRAHAVRWMCSPCEAHAVR